jgi:tetratricopeptide (TPR) repeat protein
MCSTTAPLCTDQELQITLEKYLKNYLLSSINENIQQQRKTRLSSLIKSEPEKLIHQFNLPKPISDLKHYEKQVDYPSQLIKYLFFQRELAMVATKQGDYSLSYSIYTNLLHDFQYDHQLKSDILSSRATTLLLEQKCFESIDDCTKAIVYNQWNKLAYVVRGACWMIKHEYVKAVEDYSKLFHFFDQSQHVLDLLNLAYEKSMEIEQRKIDHQFNGSISPTASFNQPAVYLCYPYQT